MFSAAGNGGTPGRLGIGVCHVLPYPRPADACRRFKTAVDEKCCVGTRWSLQAQRKVRYGQGGRD